jgi:hypothetical protein
MSGGIASQDIQNPIAEFGGYENLATVRATYGDEEPAGADVI